MLDDGKLGYTSPCEWQTSKYPKQNIDRTEVIKRIKDGYFNLFILMSPRTHAINALRDIKKECQVRPLVECDSEDYDGFKWDVFQEFQPDIVFKRELFENSDLYRQLKGRVFPLPFSAYLNPIADVGIKEKDIDIFCAFGNTHPQRQRLLDSLKSISGIKFVGGGNEYRLNYREYHEHIAGAKICFSPLGWGNDCVRHWEISQHRTLMFLERSKQIVPNEFEHLKHCVKYTSDLADVGPLVNHYLAHENEREALSLSGYNHLRQYHTTNKRAEYFLDTCKEKLGIKWR